MKWVLIGAIALATISAPSVSSAHEVPARRTITVQAEAKTAVVLVRWTSARGPQGAQLLARAAWGRSDRALKALRALAAAEALRGMRIFVGDEVASASSMQVKVRVDKGDDSNPARVVCAVLLTIDLSKGGELLVRVDGGADTGLRWFDRVTLGGARGDESNATNKRVTSILASKVWQHGRRTLRLVWPEN